MKGITTGMAIVVAVLIAVVGMGGVLYYTTSQQVESTGDIGEDIAQAIVTAPRQFSGYDVEFNTRAMDGSDAQDQEYDIDIDLFIWDPDENNELSSGKEYYLDCSGSTPAVFDGTHTQITVTEANLCKLNPYKFWRDSSFTGGDSETKIDDYLTLAKADLVDYDVAGTSHFHVSNEITYLVTVTENASTDIGDVVPFGFLFESVQTTTLDPDELENGNIDVVFAIDYYSDAASGAAASKLKISGECEDSEGNAYDLTSALVGIVDSSLTTETTVDIDCVIEVEIKDDGYAMPLVNDLAESDSERAYIVFTPYGMGANATELSLAWEEYGTGDFKGDVAFNVTTTGVAGTDRVIQQGSSACGYTLTTSSTSDAITNGDENLYEPNCFVSSAEEKFGIKGVFDKGGVLKIPIKITQILVDYDATANASTGVLEYGSTSSPEVLFDIDLVLMQATTDRLAQTFG